MLDIEYKKKLRLIHGGELKKNLIYFSKQAEFDQKSIAFIRFYQMFVWDVPKDLFHGGENLF